MKTGTLVTIAIIAAIVGALLIYLVDVDQTEQLVMPEVNVEGGNLPEFETEVADIDVETETVTMEVPKGISIDPPNDQ